MNYPLSAEKNIIIKVHYDAESNKLSLLKCKMDCSIYVKIIDLTTETHEYIDLYALGQPGNFLYSISDYENFPNHKITSKDEQYYYESYDDIERWFEMSTEIFCFEVNHSVKNILIELSSFDYKIKNEEQNRDTELTRCFKTYDFEGRNIQREITFDNFENTKSVFYYGEKIVCISDYSDMAIHFWDFKQGSCFKLKPLAGSEVYVTKEHRFKFENLESVKTYYDKKILAFIGDGHNYGATGIFIINISDFGNFKPIFQMVDSSGLKFQNLDINKIGTEIVAVVSHENDDLSINVFDLSNSKIKRFSSLDLKHNNDNHPLDIKYIHERIVLILISKILIIRTHDLVCLKTLHRDAGSDWSADGDKIVYCNTNVFYIYQTTSKPPPNSEN